LTSDATSTQFPEQILSEVNVPHTVHIPAWHAEFGGQAFPHPPQLSWSVLVSTHPEAHPLGCAGGQVQALSTQLAPGGQATVQLPQLLGSVWKSTQAIGQMFGALLHIHMPLSQIAPVGQEPVQAASGAGLGEASKASTDASASASE
jgi:hypothetical protein